MLKKAIQHFILITRHRFIVFKLCVRAGIPWRGFVHDLSKYSPTEFIESVKFYQGNYSPISKARKELGCSKAWLHHKGRNKHHFEYWYDFWTEEKAAIIPYQYTVEMICDHIAASMVYNGEQYRDCDPYEYMMSHSKNSYMNEKIYHMTMCVYKQLAEEGLRKTICKRNLKQKYQQYVIDK